MSNWIADKELKECSDCKGQGKTAVQLSIPDNEIAQHLKWFGRCGVNKNLAEQLSEEDLKRLKSGQIELLSLHAKELLGNDTIFYKEEK